MKIRPLHDRVIVKRIDEGRKTASGIVIPDTAPEKPDQGAIVAVGKGKKDEDGKLLALDVKPGDKVLFTKYSGQTVKVKGGEFLVMRRAEIGGEGGLATRITGETHLLLRAEDITSNTMGVMGGRTAFGRSVHTILDLSDHIEEGLPVAVLEHVKARSELTDNEMAVALGISTKTLARLRSTKGRLKHSKRPKLTLGMGDRLFRLARLLSFAEEVLEDRDRALQWLKKPQRGLGNRIPIELMRTEVGAREVEDLLGRIEHGVYS